MAKVCEHQLPTLMATGYAKEVRSVECTDCKQDLYGLEKVYIYDGEPVCSKCLMDRLLEELDADDFAVAFDVAIFSANRYAEGGNAS